MERVPETDGTREQLMKVSILDRGTHEFKEEQEAQSGVRLFRGMRMRLFLILKSMGSLSFDVLS